MFPIFVLSVGFIIGLICAYPQRANKVVFYERLLMSTAFFAIGIQGILFGFIPHVFFADYTAEKIGWPIGSPFQFEVGVHDGSWGLLAVLSLWFRGYFLLATCIGWSVFLLGASYGHLHSFLTEGNAAPFNYPFIIGDFVPAVVLLVLSYLYYVQYSRTGMK